MWELYDKLLEGVPDDLFVDEVICGHSWTMVRSGENVGMAMTVDGTTRPLTKECDFVGMSLKELGTGVKSWNFIEASIGLAAINAYYNTPVMAKQNGISLTGESGYAEKQDAFIACQNDIRGKKVGIVGHFPYLEERVAPICQMSILERYPRNGDYPDTACEYILPEQDYVFMTGCTLINKTLPRLLELTKNANVVLVGPSVPITPLLFDFGADNLSGFIVTDPQTCSHTVGSGNSMTVFSSGKLIRLLK